MMNHNKFYMKEHVKLSGLAAPLLYTKKEVGCEALSSISLRLSWIAQRGFKFS